jgi:hypothetical protein
MSEQIVKQNVSLIVEALRESHLAASVALLTVGELASEEIKSRQGTQDASFGHISKALVEDVKAAGGVGFDPSYISRSLSTYAVANLLADVDLVQKVPAYACKMVAPFVQRLGDDAEIPSDTPFNIEKELVYTWKEDGLADVAREFLSGVRDNIISFAGAGKWMKKALADRQLATKAGGHPDLRREVESQAKGPEMAIAKGWEKALQTVVKDEKTGKVDAVKTKHLARKGIKAAVKANILTPRELLVAIQAAASHEYDDDTDPCLDAWDKIAQIASDKVDELRGHSAAAEDAETDAETATS